MAQGAQGGCSISILGDLQSHLDTVLDTLLWCPCWSWRLDKVMSRGHFQPQPLRINPLLQNKLHATGSFGGLSLCYFCF